MNKFNDDQIEVIKTALKNQEVVWSKNKDGLNGKNDKMPKSKS